jgi:hypothetical protein
MKFEDIFNGLGDSLDKSSIERRKFIKSALIGGASLLASPVLSNLMAEETGWEVIQSTIKSRVSVVKHSKAMHSVRRVNTPVVKSMFETALKLGLDASTANQAWGKVFPNYRQGQVIALKLTCLNPYNSSHKELSYAIAASLIKWGVKPNDIILFERSAWELRRQRYKLNWKKNSHVRCFGTENPGYNPGFDESFVIPLRDGLFIGTPHFTKVLSKMCDYIINVPVLKNHSDAGVTLALKNHYGSFNNPSSYHDNYCDPYIAKLNAHPVIKDKTKLVVLDALACTYNGGPGGYPQALTKTLAVSTDPVALDTTGLLMLEDIRIKKGLNSIMNMSKHVATAAKLNLGTNNAKNITVVKESL